MVDRDGEDYAAGAGAAEGYSEGEAAFVAEPGCYCAKSLNDEIQCQLSYF